MKTRGRPKGSKNKSKVESIDSNDSKSFVPSSVVVNWPINIDTTIKVPESLYKISLSVNGQEFKSEGKTLLEAIQKLKPGNQKTKGNLEIKYGDKKLEKLLTIPQMRRLFNENPGFGIRVAQERIVKFFNMMLK